MRDGAFFVVLFWVPVGLALSSAAFAVRVFLRVNKPIRRTAAALVAGIVFITCGIAVWSLVMVAFYQGWPTIVPYLMIGACSVAVAAEWLTLKPTAIRRVEENDPATRTAAVDPHTQRPTECARGDRRSRACESEAARYIVMFAEETVGTSELEHVDYGMGVAHGAFHPTPAYSAIRPAVVTAAEALYDREQDVTAPPLAITTESGELLLTGFVIIADFDDADVDPEITVKLLDREQFERVLRRGLTSR
jgi:hypothetical protein